MKSPKKIANCLNPGAVREIGAEYAANPGSSKAEYLDDAASFMKEGVWLLSELSKDERKLCRELFQEGVEAERATQSF